MIRYVGIQILRVIIVLNMIIPDVKESICLDYLQKVKC